MKYVTEKNIIYQKQSSLSSTGTFYGILNRRTWTRIPRPLCCRAEQPDLLDMRGDPLVSCVSHITTPSLTLTFLLESESGNNSSFLPGATTRQFSIHTYKVSWPACKKMNVTWPSDYTRTHNEQLAFRKSYNFVYICVVVICTCSNNCIILILLDYGRHLVKNNGK